MTDYNKLVKALRICSSELNCGDCPLLYRDSCSSDELMNDAADAIEALQADIKRLKEANDELREKQTYIDHYGDRWMTSANDVPTAAYKHGYADGRDEAEAQLPKLGEWKTTDAFPHRVYCSNCFRTYVPNDRWQIWVDKPGEGGLERNYCPSCGAKMEVRDEGAGSV